MSLSIYDPTKGCNVLNPEKFILNAFHPDYVKTYMPEFLGSIRLEAAQKANGAVAGSKSKVLREATAGKTVNTINASYPIRASHLHRPNLAPTEFFVYSKAGTANVTPKGKKK